MRQQLAKAVQPRRRQRQGRPRTQVQKKERRRWRTSWSLASAAVCVARRCVTLSVDAGRCVQCQRPRGGGQSTRNCGAPANRCKIHRRPPFQGKHMCLDVPACLSLRWMMGVCGVFFGSLPFLSPSLSPAKTRSSYAAPATVSMPRREVWRFPDRTGHWSGPHTGDDPTHGDVCRRATGVSPINISPPLSIPRSLSLCE